MASSPDVSACIVCHTIILEREDALGMFHTLSAKCQTLILLSVCLCCHSVSLCCHCAVFVLLFFTFVFFFWFLSRLLFLVWFLWFNCAIWFRWFLLWLVLTLP